MTRPFNQEWHCPHCKTFVTCETLFGRWIRNNAKLESRNGYSVSDQDYWVHRFRTELDREFQCLMLVEIKTMGASMTDAQRDTLNTANQLMRNRRQTPTKDLRYQAGLGVLKVFSTYLKRETVVRAFGMHVLTFSGLGPGDSEWMKWDKEEITEDQLTGLLRFDLDPDTLAPMDWRRHHADVLLLDGNLNGSLFDSEAA